jgi:hypothetical protein
MCGRWRVSDGGGGERSEGGGRKAEVGGVAADEARMGGDEGGSEDGGERSEGRAEVGGGIAATERASHIEEKIAAGSAPPTLKKEGGAGDNYEL